MPQVTKQQIEQVKKIDLLSYLQQREPQELVRFSGDTYTTATHDSLKISNGKWFWWSRGIGGRSALDYLIKVREMSFVDAVTLLSDNSIIYDYQPKKEAGARSKNDKRPFSLPPRNVNNDMAINYLTKRGICREVIDACITRGILYESRERIEKLNPPRYYHNIIFVGLDANGMPRYAGYRAMGDKPYRGEREGSDKRFSFKLTPQKPSAALHLFESPIDVLSYCTLEWQNGNTALAVNCLSLGGVTAQRKDGSVSLPLALEQYLKDNPQTQALTFHLDIDKAGRAVSNALIKLLSDSYEITDEPPLYGKDYNDYLQILQSKERMRSGQGATMER